jgi:Flp pilus assembly protein CpaB
LLTALVAVGAAVATGSIVESAEAARAGWGRSATVVVATRDLEPGAALDGDDVELAVRPAVGLPHGVLHAVPDGRRLHHRVFAGELILAGHLAPAAARGLAVRLPRGSRAVAIPVEPGLVPPLEAGQLVDVLAVGAEAGEAEVVAEQAEVLDAGDEAVTVAVHEADAPRVVAALAVGVVTVTLIGAT